MLIGGSVGLQRVGAAKGAAQRCGDEVMPFVVLTLVLLVQQIGQLDLRV